MRGKTYLGAMALVIGVAVSGGTAGAAANDPATTVWEHGGSNMGLCSAFLGTAQVRDDVNRAIRLVGDRLGIENPGQIFHVRAQQDESRPPAQECLQRQQH